MSDIGLVKSIKKDKIFVVENDVYTAAIDLEELKKYIADDTVNYAKFENLK